MRKINAWLFVTLDGVMEAPENWVRADNVMFEAMEADHAKYVASTTLDSPEWQNSTVIEGDVAEALSRLKQENGKNIMVNGSATLVRSLLRDNLLDELQVRQRRHLSHLPAGRQLSHQVVCAANRRRRP